MSKIRPNKKNKAGDTKDTLTPTKSTVTAGSGATASTVDAGMLFHKSNYMLMLGGLALIFLGYLLMSGGHQTDPNVFDEDVIYSTRRTLLAPIVILAGLGMEVYAVFKK